MPDTPVLILDHARIVVGDLREGCPRKKLGITQPVRFFVSPLKFIVELIEAPEHQHVYGPTVRPEREVEA